MTAIESDKLIIKIAVLIPRQEKLITMEKLRNTVRKVMEMLSGMNQFSDVENIVEERIIREIETLCNVYVPATSTLDDMRDHQE
ncbi:MAG TPA: hypothetical protein VEL31_20015 [Ktedonobacteraceae bacterium]|nr:hypothetical protein [Ktedonobacteraceae bacterium]